MKLKPFISLILFLLFSFSTAFPAEKGFNKGSIILTPVLGLNGFTIPFGASFEYGISRNIGVGGTAMLWFWSNDLWSNTLISLSVDAAYHLTSLKVKKLDLFAGGGLGYSIYSWSWISGCCAVPPGSSGSSGLYLEPFIGARYYFSSKTTGFLRFYVDFIGDWTGAGGMIGVSFRLK